MPQALSAFAPRRLSRWVVPVTGDELLITLAAVPGARRLPTESPLTESMLIAGIEIAGTRPAAERTLRKIWRDRRGTGATPLLLIADDVSRPGCLTVLGTVDAAGPLRSIDAGALSEVLTRLAGRPRLEAVRELAAELDRLDQAGIPGLKLRDLLTIHTLDVRFRKDPSRWGQASDATKAIARGADWRAVLTGLGYHVERLPRRGFLARHEGRPIAVVHPVRDAAEFSRLDADGRPPEGLLLNDCQTEGAAFGILAASTRLRLFETDPQVGSAASRYVDLDSAALQVDDFPFLALLAPDYLSEGEFAALQEEARNFGAGLRRRLDETIRQTVLPTLGRALGKWSAKERRDATADETREELERAALTLVFRALFILYAESAGYLPMDNRSYRQASLTNLVDEASDSRDRLGIRSTSLWDRFVLLVKAMRTGNPAWGVPAYNGALFAADGFEGAATLESASFSDPDFATILVGLGRDPETGGGIDYSTLEIGHLGHIYEGLLSLRLSAADTALVYDAAKDRYVAPQEGEPADLQPGELLWQTHEGGRKGGGVYYTRTELVRHLVRGAVVPAFIAHLDRVRERAEKDPAGAAAELFDFAVLDPACGSAHFLVVVVNELADLVVRFLADTPLPEVRSALERLRAGASPGAVIEDVALLRRLVLKRCVFGVDVSPMGAEVATLSLWLTSFVPGLSLAYLGRNVIVGNSLVGVARPEALRAGHPDRPALWDDALARALEAGTEAALRVAEGEDRTPDEYEQSEKADAELHDAVAGVQRLFDLWTAEPFGVDGSRALVELYGPSIIEGRDEPLIADAKEQRERHRFLHWPLAFPHVFSRANPGFDAVIGNPPWEQVMVKSVEFFAWFRPGLRGMVEEDREHAISDLLRDRPDLNRRLATEQERSATERSYFTSSEYESTTGHPDLYKLFCQRYGVLLRHEGRLGVVLPRSAFNTDGSAGFREWLFERNNTDRVDFLLNTRRWMFDTHAQYTVALVTSARGAPGPQDRTAVAGTAESLEDFLHQAASSGLELPRTAFGPNWTTPLLRSQSEADLLVKLRAGGVFPLGPNARWKCFAVQELNETFDRALWSGARSGSPLWKGESFDQYDPHGSEARLCPVDERVLAKIHKTRPGAGSMIAESASVQTRLAAVADEVTRARVAFHDVANRLNARTAIACLVPPGVLLTNKAPYLVFVKGGDVARAAALAIFNSLPFDWQARRFVERSLNFFILEGLGVPDLSDREVETIGKYAAELSCVDERFSEFASSFGLEPGPLPDDERERLRIEIDALVARAWNLTTDDLDVLFRDFSTDSVPETYRRKLRERLTDLS